MKTRLAAHCALAFATGTAFAAPEYVAIHMETDVARPVAETWARVGNYCDISEWLAVDCKIVSGDGGIGTVRLLRGGQVTEILVGKTALSYGYAQPVREGQFYNLYHGYLEARPTGANTSKLIYTLLLDESDKPDQAAKDADVAARRKRFEAALQKMKALAEGKTVQQP
jgi:hypothetical protein